MTNEQRELRSLVRGAYDIQKLRIETGNRIVSDFKVKLGQKPSAKEEELSAEAKDILAELRAGYTRITDGVVKFPNQSQFEPRGIIDSYTLLCLVGQFVRLERLETEHFKRVRATLEGFPIYMEFLKGVQGVGPAMAGVIISEIDIHKATYPSSLWAYAGLDVVASWELSNVEWLTPKPASLAECTRVAATVPATKPLLALEVFARHVTFDEMGPALALTFARDNHQLAACYRWNDNGGRSRRRDHLREYSYIDKNGKPATRVGLTFNPWLKTKLIGVLASLFLQAIDWTDVDDATWSTTPEHERRIKQHKNKPDRKQVIVAESPYRRSYLNYKHRMENHAKYGVHRDKETDEKGHKVTGKGRRHNMAMRYAVKMFLVDLYKAWRELEGLPVSPPYCEAKLERVHRQVE